jgi:hypothetical protein
MLLAYPKNNILSEVDSSPSNFYNFLEEKEAPKIKMLLNRMQKMDEPGHNRLP